MWKEDFTYCDEVTVDEEIQAANKERLVDIPMQIRCIEDAWIVPFGHVDDLQGEIIDRNGHIIPNVCSGAIYPQTDERTYPNITADKNGEEIIYLGSINICWGHYITDGIAKMWCLDKPAFKELINRGVKVAFCAEWVDIDKMPNAWRHVIDCLGGVEVEIIPLREVTHYQRIYVPTNSIFNTPQGRFFTKEFVDTIQLLKQNALKDIKGKTYDKLYFSRTHLKSNHGEFGEHYLEKLFKKIGFKILYPEELSFEQQVYYLSHAKSVAGTMGSITHNFMFCQPNTEVIILRKAWYTNDFQYVINQAFGLNVTYIDCHLSVFTTDNPNLGPFFLYANDNVRRFLEERYSLRGKNNFSIREYMRYVRTCLKRPDMKWRTESPEYYYLKLREELNNCNWKHQIIKVMDYLLPQKVLNALVTKFVRLGR